MHAAPPTVIAIDGLPASPSMAAALAQMAAMGEASKARQARIDADPRIIWLRGELAAMRAPLAHGMAGAASIFADMANGRAAHRARIGLLIRARIQMLDHFPHIARKHLRDAAGSRRQSRALASATQLSGVDAALSRMVDEPLIDARAEAA